MPAAKVESALLRVFQLKSGCRTDTGWGSSQPCQPRDWCIDNSLGHGAVLRKSVLLEWYALSHAVASAIVPDSGGLSSGVSGQGAYSGSTPPQQGAVMPGRPESTQVLDFSTRCWAFASIDAGR